MSEAKRVEVQIFAEDILLWLDSQDSSNQSLRMAIKKLLAESSMQGKESIPITKGSPELPFKAENIPWKQRRNEKGPFELSDAFDNKDHQALLAFLQQHAGDSIVSNGQFYWIFNTDNKTIGRKLAKQVQRRK